MGEKSTTRNTMFLKTHSNTVAVNQKPVYYNSAFKDHFSGNCSMRRETKALQFGNTDLL